MEYKRGESLKRRMTNKKRNKTLLIGWDAADWNVVNPLLEKGLMPTLKGLLKKGSHGKIATLNPPLSPILWTSIATGKRAYDHGICGFTEVSEDQKSVQAVRGTSRKATPRRPARFPIRRSP